MDDEFRAKKITPFINGRKIIDLGGGSTNVHKYIKKLFPQITCLDIEEGIDLNKDFKIEKNHDTILALELIEHLNSPIEFIRKCKTFMNKNSKLIITTPNAGLQYFINPSWQVRNTDSFDGHRYVFTIPMVKCILEDEGFEIIHEEYLNVFWYNRLAKFICKLIPKLRNDFLIVARKK